MDAVRGLSWAVAALIVASAVAAGPLVPGAGIGAAGAPPTGEGTATVEVRSMPATVTLERAAFGAGVYRFEAAPATVAVRSVDGNPALKYAIDVPGLDYADITTRDLHGREGETVRLGLARVGISPERVTRSAYEARLTVWVVGEERRYRAIRQLRLTVEVEG